MLASAETAAGRRGTPSNYTCKIGTTLGEKILPGLPVAVSNSIRTTLGDKILRGLPIAVPKIILPTSSVNMNTWAVIAGDKYTANEEYWKRADAFYADRPSAKNIIFPEAYLSCNGGGTPETDRERMDAIWATGHSYLDDGVFDDKPAAFVAVERDTPLAKDRRGLLLAVDLEHYSYENGKRSLIRPTMKTISERLPDCVTIRERALLELPHIIMFIDDGDCSVIEPLFDDPDFLDYAYTADLFGHAGQVRGSRVTKDGEAHVVDALREFVASRDVLLMVGDGNHSLAAAKACWEAAKPTAPPNDARRYALVEVQNLHDPAVAFQPIHRVLFNVNVPNLLGELEKLWPHNPSESEREVIFLSPDGSETKLTTARDIMSVVEVSEVLDSFLRANKETRIDFVHGEQVARDEVAKRGPTTAALLLPPIAKANFLTTLKQCGSMPPKAFSTGHAIEKRFYIEARKIRSSNEYRSTALLSLLH
jgi:hypothetical protein